MKRYIVIVFFVFVAILLWCIYYFVPRHVNFELVQTFDQPVPYFDRTKEINFNYIHDRDDVWFWFGEWYSTHPYFIEKNIVGYDSIFIKQLADELDYSRFDYIVTYQRELKELKHSPCLSHDDAAYYFDKRTPLIPVFKEKHTTKVYIYRIKKNGDFRSTGP